MTISTSVRKAGPYTGNGVTVTFPFAFKVFATTDVLVTESIIATGVETVKALATDYTVSLNADQNAQPGGNIVANVAPAATVSWTFSSQVAETQGVDIANLGGFYPSVLNAAFDKLTILVQQLREVIGRALVFAVSDTGSGQLPGTAARANKFLAFGPTGLPIAATGTGTDTALRTDLGASSGSAIVGWIQSGTGAVVESVQTKLRRLYVAPEEFGAVGNGVDDDADAFGKATATGKTIQLGKGKNYVIASVVSLGSMVGEGADDGQSQITLTSAGQIKPIDQWVSWSGFLLTSSVNAKTFVKVSFSYFRWDNFYIHGTGTTQVGIEFDTTSSLYQCAITNHRINGVATPYSVTGAGSCNNNQIGSDNSYVQAFTNALDVAGTVTIFGANNVRGYYETGTNFLKTATVIRDNTFAVWLDAVTQAVNASVAVAHNHWPFTPPEAFVTTGAGVVGVQDFIEKIKFRAYLNTTDQTIADNTLTKVQWNAETFDPDSTFVLAPNYQFLAPRAMKILVIAQADISGNLASADRTVLAIYKNGVEVTEAKHYCASGINGARPRVMDILDLVKGDYVEIFALADQTAGAGTHVVSAGTLLTYFCGTEL